ncbi:MAG: class I SAM-dependent methyltransferase [Phormidesmis sp.]
MTDNIPSSSDLIDYWDSSVSSKEFRHPLPKTIIDQYFAGGAKILDMGCGYGRLATQLADLGFAVAGTDTSPAMLEQARKNAPDCEFKPYQNVLPWADDTFEVVLLVTLLTSVPSDLEQRQIMSEVKRVLKPEGCIFVSDMPLQWSSRYVERYADGLKRYGQFGVFDMSDGGTVRHHELSYFMQLMAGFTCHKLENYSVETMNGNQAQAMRFVGRLAV